MAAAVGTATDMVTPTKSTPRFQQQGWRSPSGRVFMTNFDGLLVHEP